MPCPISESFVAPPFTETMSQPLPPGYFLQISQFNVERGKEGTEQLVSNFANQTTGIACVNEADTPTARAMKAVSGLDNEVDGWALKLEDGNNYGNVIFTDLEVKSSQTYKLPLLDSQEPRVALFATLDYEGQDLLVVASHLSNGPNNHKERQAQVDTILGHLKSQAYQGRLLILCGDFNMTSDSPGYHNLSKEFIDSAAAIPGAAHVATLPGNSTRIDYVWVNEDFELVMYRVSGGDTSDHCRAELWVAPKKQQ
jgi:endonuclease/exonuclease/phosphatase family metal-dependent hydrolase